MATFSEKPLLFSFYFYGEEEVRLLFFVSKSYVLVRGRGGEGMRGRGRRGATFRFSESSFFATFCVFRKATLKLFFVRGDCSAKRPSSQRETLFAERQGLNSPKERASTE